MYFYASLFVAFVITLLVISKIAEMLLAKRFSLIWVFLASLVSGASAVFVYILLSLFVKGIDPMVMLIASLSTMFIVSSAAFKYINQMSWTGAITTNIANIAVVLITLTAAVVLNGKSLEEEFASINSVAKNNMTVIESAASDYQNGVAINDIAMAVDDEQQPVDMVGFDGEQVMPPEEILVEDTFEDEEPQITERDLLSPAAAKELDKRERVVYKEPKFHVTNVGSVHTLVGHTIRILKSNGNTISGALKKVSGSSIYVEQRISNGVAVTPLAIAKIRKLEVYRK